jgi:hypothetical protein
MGLGGHLWTVLPRVRHALRPVPPPPSVAWHAVTRDPAAGPVLLTGRLSTPERDGGARSCVVVLHGMGGDCDAHYAIACARAADREGLASLRLNLRDAGPRAEDLYHAALTSDIRQAIESPELSKFESIYLVGYSIGGHLALRYATETVDARLAAVAAVCPPLDLERSVTEIDRPMRWVYRQYLLAGLKHLYSAISARHKLPLRPSEARKIRYLRDWDERIIAPRFGFRSAGHYYAEASAGPRLGELHVPALLIAAAADPMVPAHTIAPALAAPPHLLDVRWIAEGGHVGFPRSFDLGLGAPKGLDTQLMRWLLERAPADSSRP